MDDPDPGVWTPGRVAALLGVSPITLRSWDSRYGLGPSTRAEGRQRRYSDADVGRLRRMRRLIDRGVRAREAAHLVLSGGVSALSVADGVRELGEAAEAVRFGSMAALLDDLLAAKGPADAWHEVIAPVLRAMEARWTRGDQCYASEWALTGEVSAAIERFVLPLRQTASGRPVLLVCTPGERHSLPLEVLRAALADDGIPVVFLGEMVPPETTAGLVEKLDPVAVVLWAMTPDTAGQELAGQLTHARLCLAGAGWNRDHDLPWVNDLEGALTLLSDLSSAAPRVQ
jgi:MerR family transcriptional regulator, light-induced transcriptional regulator